MIPYFLLFKAWESSFFMFSHVIALVIVSGNYIDYFAY